MIKTRQDLKDYTAADERHLERKSNRWLHRIFFSEQYFIQRYLTLLRKLEYLTNKSRTLPDKIRYVLILWRYRKLVFKMQINIPVNVAGPGLQIYHIGPIIINSNARLGSNCSLQPGVVIGQKDGPETVPSIGDNVYFGPGAKVIGKITIGNNVVIAPNSVVISNVPDNCVVSGIPAVIIKQNGIRIRN